MTATEMFGAARWVTAGDATRTPYFRGEFCVGSKVKRAEITICGLGFFELFLNGRRIGDELFVPANSNYHAFEKQYCLEHFGEKLSHRTYCLRYDITREMEQHNCIGVALAPGWYRYTDRQPQFWYGHVKLCFAIRVFYENGQTEDILSSKDLLKWTQGHVVYSHMHTGETQDYAGLALDGWNRVGFDDGEWNCPEEIAAPETRFFLQDCPPDRVIRYISPRLIAETEEYLIYDMGENITGTPIIKPKTKDICKIELKVSERINADNSLEDYTNHKQRSEFIADGSDRLYSLRFTWYGFRYAAVSKNAEIVSCAVIHADVAVTSSFRCDVPTLTWLYDAYVRTQLDNYHCGVPSDCPHIERRGYTGDGQLVGECGMMLFDSRTFYRKWLRDIADCQDTVSGHVQYTAPYIRSGGGPGGWGCAIIEVPYTYYKMYGDTSVLEEFLPRALHYFEYLEAHSEDELVVSDQPEQWCLGDWCTPEKTQIPEPFVNTYFHVKSLLRAIEICRILGKTDELKDLAETVARKKAAIVKRYFDTETGNFAGNIQGANAFAVDLGLGDERTFANMVAHYRKNTVYDTGIFGTDIVTRVLFERNENQLAFDLLTSKGQYSFWRWMTDGCTTLPEYWTYERSQNHPMFGAVTKYLFQYLLGIRAEEAGYKRVTVEPRFVDGMDYAEGHIGTTSGRIYVKYVKKCENVSIDVETDGEASVCLRVGGRQVELEGGKQHFVFALT